MPFVGDCDFADCWPAFSPASDRITWRVAVGVRLQQRSPWQRSTTTTAVRRVGEAVRSCRETRPWRSRRCDGVIGARFGVAASSVSAACIAANSTNCRATAAALPTATVTDRIRHKCYTVSRHNRRCYPFCHVTYRIEVYCWSSSWFSPQHSWFFQRIRGISEPPVRSKTIAHTLLVASNPCTFLVYVL